MCITTELGVQWLYIHMDWVVVTHPRTNGQVEHAKGLIL
jgi:hypothetical protein